MKQRNEFYSKSGPESRRNKSSSNENRSAILLCAAMTLSACVLMQSRAIYHMDLDAASNPDGDGGTNPKHIPFHRRGGEKYSLHLGHRPPKLQKQQRDKKRARQQQQQAQEELAALQEGASINAQNNENNEFPQEIQDAGGVDINNNDGIDVKNDNTIITPTQPADPVAQQDNIIPDNSEQALETQPQVEQRPQPTEAPKSILSELLLGEGDTPPKRDPFSCEGMMARIQQDGIQLVAFDFDKSILDIHTKGKWKGSASDLVPHVRPDMKCLIRNCRERGIHVAVATFSTQKDLIQEVLQEALGYARIEQQEQQQDEGPGGTGNQESHTANDASSNSIHLFTGPYIPVYGRDDVITGSNKGKQSQLLMAMEAANRQLKISMVDVPVESEAAHLQPEDHSETTNKDGEKLSSTSAPVIITAASTLLVDDDRQNIQTAIEDGYQTILFRPDDALTKAAPAVLAAEAAAEENSNRHQ